MSGIGVITNPKSRRNLRNPRLAGQLAYILGERGELAQPADLNALAAVAQRFRERDIDILCINGGDGTMHAAMSAMVKAYGDHPLPRIAILRSGTMNTIAHGLGVKGNASEILDYVVQRYHAGDVMPTKRRWLMSVDGEHYGFLFGNGLIARFLEVYYEGSEPSPTKALWLLLRACASAAVGGAFIKRLLTPFRGTANLDGVEWPMHEWMTVSAGTSDDIGVGFRPFFKALSHPNAMHVVGVASMNAMVLVRQLPRIWRAKQVRSPDIYDDVARKLVLTSDQPISYMIDGDFHRGGTSVTVSMGPAVDFVVPERA